MQYEVELGGRTRRVSVTRTGDSFAVAVDDHTWNVDVARISPCMLSLIGDTARGQRAEFTGIVREVVVVPGQTGERTVFVGSVPVVVFLNAGGRWARRKGQANVGGGPQRITAPMPGKVVRVLVKAGEQVRAGQPVVVVEAMKMENELRTTRDGLVAEMPAREGTSVETGALLVVIQ